MPRCAFRAFPTTVTFPDGRSVPRALVLDQGSGVGIYSTGAEAEAFVGAEPVGDRGVVRVAMVSGTVEPGGPGWVIDTGEGLVGVERSGGCGCGAVLARWQP